jgi:nicotinamidase-related amidase
MMNRWSQARQMLASALAAGMLACGMGPAGAQTIIDDWKSVTIPPPPDLLPVTADSAHTALLILDMYATTCPQRPSCVRSIPHVKALLDQARAHKMLVIFSGGPMNSPNPITPVAPLAPQAGEPTVRSGADKFLGSDLEKILNEAGIKSVIVTGTSADAAVLYTASEASLRGLNTYVPIDCMSSLTPFAELYTTWHLKNVTPAVSSHVTLTRSDLITMH